MKTKLALLSLSLLSCLAFASVAWAHGHGPGHDEGTEATAPSGDEENVASTGDAESGEDLPTLEPKAESETDESDEDTMGSAE